MADQNLLNYINSELDKRSTKQAITSALLSQGWQQSQIEEAFLNIENKIANPVPKPPAPSQTNNNSHFASAESNLSMWDAFQHIIFFISLYVMTSAIALLLHFFVDQWIPDPIKDSIYSYGGFSSFQVNGYISALIVSSPIFISMYLLIKKRTNEDPEIKNLESRKILIYLTLIITFIILLYQLIGIVFNFLSGNVSLNSLSHFIVTVSISGIIFVNFLREVRANK